MNIDRSIHNFYSIEAGVREIHVEDIKVGTLLVATPFMDDPMFVNAVCLIYNIIKKRNGNHIIEALNIAGDSADILADPESIELDQSGLLKTLKGVKINKPLFIAVGGPVDRDTSLIMHSFSDVKSDHYISPNYYLSDGLFEPFSKFLSAPKGEGLFGIFRGKACWTMEQLAGEIDEDCWVVTPNSLLGNNDMFLGKQLHDIMLQRLAGRYEVWRHFPNQPTWN